MSKSTTHRRRVAGRRVRGLGEGFARDPVLVRWFSSERRAAMAGRAPSAAHRALVALEARLGGRCLLATQTIDGLHAAAGSTRVIAMHGTLTATRFSLVRSAV